MNCKNICVIIVYLDRFVYLCIDFFEPLLSMTTNNESLGIIGIITSRDNADDMPAHAKSTMIGVSLNIPITRGRLNLGIWQGIYLCEHRDYGGSRTIVATIYS